MSNIENEFRLKYLKTIKTPELSEDFLVDYLLKESCNINTLLSQSLLHDLPIMQAIIHVVKDKNLILKSQKIAEIASKIYDFKKKQKLSDEVCTDICSLIPLKDIDKQKINIAFLQMHIAKKIFDEELKKKIIIYHAKIILESNPTLHTEINLLKFWKTFNWDEEELKELFPNNFKEKMVSKIEKKEVCILKIDLRDIGNKLNIKLIGLEFFLESFKAHTKKDFKILFSTKKSNEDVLIFENENDAKKFDFLMHHCILNIKSVNNFKINTRLDFKNYLDDHWSKLSLGYDLDNKIPLCPQKNNAKHKI